MSKTPRSTTGNHGPRTVDRARHSPLATRRRRRHAHVCLFVRVWYFSQAVEQQRSGQRRLLKARERRSNCAGTVGEIVQGTPCRRCRVQELCGQPSVPTTFFKLFLIQHAHALQMPSAQATWSDCSHDGACKQDDCSIGKRHTQTTMVSQQHPTVGGSTHPNNHHYATTSARVFGMVMCVFFLPSSMMHTPDLIP